MRSILLLCFLLLCHATLAQTSPQASRSLDESVRFLSGRYLNYDCSAEQDSVLELCAKAERLALERHDYVARFEAQQLAVNALCLHGDIVQGINRAARMYEEAKLLNNPQGTALAIQAIGAAYMHCGQYRQAHATFQEAEPLMEQNADTLSRLRFVIQQLHVAMNLLDTAQMTRYLADADRFCDALPSDVQADYRFYLNCYQIIDLIWTGRLDQAYQDMTRLKAFRPRDGFFLRWIYYVHSCYYAQTENTLKALNYSDSTFSALHDHSNISQYKNSLGERVLLLEKMGLDQQACDVYQTIDSLTDSLNRLTYAEQIEELHLAYWVDKMAIDNMAAHNKLLSSVIFYAILCLLFCALGIVLSKRKNRQLKRSHLKLATARETAAESIQSKSMFLSNMSHELRTPLNAIVGFSGILTDADGVDPETKELCRENIRQNADLLIKLVNDVVDFSDLREAKISLVYEPCEAVTLCRNVVETVEKVKQTMARLQFSSPLESLELYTDKGRLQQVLINLLVNATKFTREGTITLTLNVDEERHEAIFAVEDTGCGIPPEKQARIFERFEKLHENIQGVGLGLSICQLIVDQWQGRIWIDPTYAKGARFVFSHPLPAKRTEP